MSENIIRSDIGGGSEREEGADNVSMTPESDAVYIELSITQLQLEQASPPTMASSDEERIPPELQEHSHILSHVLQLNLTALQHGQQAERPMDQIEQISGELAREASQREELLAALEDHKSYLQQGSWIA